MPQSKRHMRRRKSRKIRSYTKVRNYFRYNKPMPREGINSAAIEGAEASKEVQQMQQVVEQRAARQKNQNFLGRAANWLRKFFSGSQSRCVLILFCVLPLLSLGQSQDAVADLSLVEMFCVDTIYVDWEPVSEPRYASEHHSFSVMDQFIMHQRLRDNQYEILGTFEIVYREVYLALGSTVYRFHCSDMHTGYRVVVDFHWDIYATQVTITYNIAGSVWAELRTYYDFNCE